VTSYIIERLCGGSGDSEGSEGGVWQLVGHSYVRHMVVWDLVAGQQYQFRVYAENMFGRSVAGEESEPIVASGLSDYDASIDMNYDSLGAYNLMCLRVA